MKKNRRGFSYIAPIVFFLIVIGISYQAYLITFTPKIVLPLLNSSVCNNHDFSKITKEDEQRFLKRQKYKLKVDHCVIPHPDKKHYGGEDAYFVDKTNYTMGVTDGVGAWSAVENIEVHLYSRALMKHAKELVERRSVRDPLAILCYAENKTSNIVGSATTLVLTLDVEDILLAHIGDCGLRLVRDGKIAFATNDIMHTFNLPFQIGTGGDGLDTSKVEALKIRENDILVIATDGLWDNLFDFQILATLANYPNEANQLCSAAMKMALAAIDGPFAVEAALNNIFMVGGKVDDITVILAQVVSLNHN